MRLVADAARRNVALDAGAPSMQAWLKTRYRLRPSEAKRDLELAGLLARSEQNPHLIDAEDQAPREGSAVAAGLWSGAVHLDQARVICHALEELPADASVDNRVIAEQILVDQAADHDPATLTRLGHRILEAVDPDAADRHLATVLEREAREAERLRSATRFSDGHGSVFYKLRVPVADDAFLWPVLDTLAAPVPEADGVRDERAPSSGWLMRSSKRSGGFPLTGATTSRRRPATGARHHEPRPAQERPRRRGAGRYRRPARTFRGQETVLRRRAHPDGPRHRRFGSRPGQGCPLLHRGSSARRHRPRPGLYPPGLRTTAAVVRRTSRDSLVARRQNQPRQRCPTLRLPPQAPRTSRVADPIRR